MWDLGVSAELGYGMLFGSDVKKQFFRSVSRGVDIVMWEQALSVSFTPLVEGHDFFAGYPGSLADKAGRDGDVRSERRRHGLAVAGQRSHASE